MPALGRIYLVPARASLACNTFRASCCSGRRQDTPLRLDICLVRVSRPQTSVHSAEFPLERTYQKLQGTSQHTIVIACPSKIYSVRFLCKYTHTDFQLRICPSSSLLSLNGTYESRCYLFHATLTTTTACLHLPRALRARVASKHLPVLPSPLLECAHRPSPSASASTTRSHMSMPGSVHRTRASCDLLPAPSATSPPRGSIDSRIVRVRKKRSARSRHDTTLRTVFQSGQRQYTRYVPALGCMECPLALTTLFRHLTGALCPYASFELHVWRDTSRPRPTPLSVRCPARHLRPIHERRPRTPAHAPSTTE